MLEKFEKLVFKLVRGSFLILAVLAFITLIIFGIFLINEVPKIFKDEKNVSVRITYEDVRKQMEKFNSKPETEFQSQDDTISKEQKQDLDKERQTKDEISILVDKIMKALDEKFQDDFMYYYDKKRLIQVFRGILKNINKRDLNDFIDGIIVVIKQTPKENVFSYIDKYIELYHKKKESEINRITSEKQKAKNNILAYLGSIASSLLIIISAGIILILAAIERNTRNLIKNE